MMETAEEVVDAPTSGASLLTLDGLAKIRAGLTELATDAPLDLSIIATPAGYKTLRAYRARCVKIRTSADAAYEAVNRPLLTLQRGARDLLKEIKACVDSVEAPVDRAIVEEDRRQQAIKDAAIEAERIRVANLRARVGAIAAHAQRAVGKSADEIQGIIQQVVALDLSDMAELKAAAESAQAGTLEQLRGMHTAQVARDEQTERNRLESLRLERINLFQGRLSELRNSARPFTGPRVTSQALATIIENLPEVDDDWEEFTVQAIEARDAVLAELRELHGFAVEREQAAAEQKATAEKLEQQQAEVARLQRAESDRLEALAVENRAAADRIEAEERIPTMGERYGLPALDRPPPATQGAETAIEAPAADLPEVLSYKAIADENARAWVDSLPETVDPRPPINVGEIARRLGFNLPSAFIVETLGVPSVEISGRKGVYWPEPQWTEICLRLAAHVRGLS